MSAVHALGMRVVGAHNQARVGLGMGLLFVVAFFTQGLFFIRANAPTYDEAMHIAAGYSYLATREFRLEPQNPPLIKEFLALPLFLIDRLPFQTGTQHWRDGAEYLVGQDFVYRSALPADYILLLARLPNLLIGGLIVVLIGWWAFRIWGTSAATMAMALACFEPNLVAHSCLVTTDVAATLFIALTIYFLWEYLDSPSWLLLTAIGLSLGTALVSKFSSIVLIPVIGLIFALSLLPVGERQKPLLPHSYLRLRSRVFSAAVAVLIIFVFAALVIPAAYFFQGFQPWLSGLQRFLTLAEQGQPAFFLGEYSHNGWWNYFLVAFLIKTPLGSLTLIAASLLFYRTGALVRTSNTAILWAPVALIFLATTQANVNIGLRHILPVYPFLFVAASRLATIHSKDRWLTKLMFSVPLGFTLISSLSIAPHQLAYFNETIGGPSQGYRYLADSSLDWGQDLKGLKRYMERQNIPILYLSYFGSAPPSYYGIRYQYVPGTWPLEWPPPADKVPATAPRKILAISVNNLQDVSTAYNPLFRWLWLRQPIAKIGYSIFIYDLTEDREGLAKLEETYAKAGIQPPP